MQGTANKGDVSSAGNRIRDLRKTKGLTLEQLAELTGTSNQQIQRLETGQRRLTLEWMQRIAGALGCAPSDLINDAGLKFYREPLREVPVVSWVEAGKFAETSDPYELGGEEKTVPVPSESKTLIALVVAGQSMNRVAEEGDLVIVDYAEKALIDGKFYVFRNGPEATFKRYRANPPRLEPYSTDPAYETLFPKDPLDVVGRVVKVMKNL